MPGTPQFRILLIISFATAISWIAWIIVILNLDPYTVPGVALTLFYSSLCIALIGAFTLILFFLKRWKTNNDFYAKHIMISLRQGILLGITTIICLGLLMLGLLRIWNGLMIVFITMLIEFYISGKDELN